MLGRHALADDAAQVQRVFNASDFPHLAHGIKLPQAGEYTLKVWSAGNRHWSAATSDDVVTLKSTVEGEDAKPSWQEVGRLAMSDHVKIVVDGIDRVIHPADSDDKEKTEPVAVPSALSLSSSADFDPSAWLDATRNRLATASAPTDARRTVIRSNQHGNDFAPTADKDAWLRRAAEVRQHLLVTLGLWPLPPKTPLNPRVFGKIERETYTIEKVVLETFPGFTLSGNLYRPKGKTGSRPGLLCPHGHHGDGRVNEAVQARCIHWAELGAVVFMYDMVGYNDSKEFGHEFLNDRLNRWGISLPTLQTWNSIRSLDWIGTLPDVDPARIGCTGASGGGTQTFLLTAIDDRVKFSAPVVMVSENFQGGCVCENAAGLRIGTDNVEFAALMAPRPMKLVGATGDWTKNTLTKVVPPLQAVYAMLGRPGDLQAEVFDFPHNYNQTSRNAVYPFLADRLMPGENANTDEGEIKIEAPEDLWTFNDANPRPADAKTPAEMEAFLIDLKTHQLDALKPGDDPALWQASALLLREALRVRIGIKNPAPGELVETKVRDGMIGAFTVQHLFVGRQAREEQIPVTVLQPVKPGGATTIVMTPHGKAGLFRPKGGPSKLARALLERGQTVVGFDPLLVGESVDPSAFQVRRPDVVHFETYNPALPIDRLQDLATVLAWARSRDGVRQVNLVGQGNTGPLVLLALPLFEALGRTAIDLHEFDYGDGSKMVPRTLDVPGVLQFGGLKTAAALACPAPLWIHHAGDGFAADWARQAYRLADSEGVLTVDPQRAAPNDLADWIADTSK
jgi:dienelactone hydrolase